MIVECRNLTKHFRRHEAVKDLNILAPDSGSARVPGMDSARLRENELQHIGYVCDNPALPGTPAGPPRLAGRRPPA